MLFSGDHILNGSTTVINPPDGHMGDYLDSLAKMRDLPNLTVLFGAHGPAVVFAALVAAHALARAASVAAMGLDS